MAEATRGIATATLPTRASPPVAATGLAGGAGDGAGLGLTADLAGAGLAADLPAGTAGACLLGAAAAFLTAAALDFFATALAAAGAGLAVGLADFLAATGLLAATALSGFLAAVLAAWAPADLAAPCLISFALAGDATLLALATAGLRVVFAISLTVLAVAAGCYSPLNLHQQPPFWDTSLNPRNLTPRSVRTS